MATDHREAEQPVNKSDFDLPEEDEFVETNEVPGVGNCNSAFFDTTDELDDLNLNLCNGVIQNHRGTITSLIRRRTKKERTNTLKNEETDPELVNSNASEDANSIEQSEFSSELSETEDENQNGLEDLSLQDTESVPEESPSVALVPSSSETDYVNSLEWKQQKKHIFILSESGKPIYSRHGSEDKLVTIMGVMQALVSFVQDDKDNLRSIVAGDHTFVFMNRDHLTFVGVTRGRESTQQMLLQLTYMYNQVISVLTHSTLVRTFKQHRNFDLRRPLSGAEKFFDNLLNLMDVEPGLLLTSVRCLPLDSSVRDIVSQTIVQHAKVKDLVFALIIAQNQLVALVRMKRYYLHPMDLHLIINLINASESFKAAESWTPICLPKFDATGFLQAYVSYLDDECQSCLLLLSVDIEAFYTLSECRAKIKERLERYNALTAISNSLQRHSYSVQQCSIGDLRHFLYKARSTAQYTSPELGPPYNTPEQQDRLFGLYHFLHDQVHSVSRPLKLLYHVGKYETLLGWVTQGFELYAVFGPLVTKNVAIHAVNKLLRWIKREEDRLFILSSVTF